MNPQSYRKLLIWLGALAMGAACEQARAVDFHVATAQQLQNALTVAAANGADDNIYLTKGKYAGDFNFNSSEANNLTLLPEPGLTSTDITIDGAGFGRGLNISSSGALTITVLGINFARNCGSTSIGALRIGAGGSATILVNGCTFLSPANSSGMGLELASGLNATVTNCTAAGSPSGGGGTGISISGVTSNVTVQNRTITTNTAGLSVSRSGVVAATGSLVIGNKGSFFAGGPNCSITTVPLSGNTFTGNSATGNPGHAGAEVGGGALCFCSGASMTVPDNTFQENSAGSEGGLYASGPTIHLLDNLVVENAVNTTSSLGGGIWVGVRTTATDRLNFVMELVKGARVTDFCQEHEPSTPTRLDLFLDVCRAA